MGRYYFIYLPILYNLTQMSPSLTLLLLGERIFVANKFIGIFVFPEDQEVCNLKKNTLFTIILTALITCLLTNTVRDARLTQKHNGLDRKLQTVSDIIENYSIYDTDTSAMADAAATAMTDSLNDPYTNYYSAQEYESFMSEIQNSYTGIGIILGSDTSSGKLIVISPIEGQAAEQCGILSGDYILAIDDTSYSANQMKEAVAAIKCTESSASALPPVKLTIQRNSEIFDVTVPRGTVNRESVSVKTFPDGVGYLRITQFNSKDNSLADAKDTYDEFTEKLSALGTENISSLIIDLRNNPGGDLDVVTKIADRLLPYGVITYTEDKDGEKKYYTSDENSLNLPMVVLVNGGSASASEVLSGALKDFKKATLVGEKTFGKGVVQSVFPLYDGSGITVTSARYFTPSGVCIHGEGIEPDVEIKGNSEKAISQLSLEEDLQLQKAIEILTEK